MWTLDGKSIFVAGHRGMVGSAVARRLESEPCRLITATRDELDLMDQASVDRYMAAQKPDGVIICAAKVGGILANNSYPAEFLYNNLMIEANLINSAYKHGVSKLLFLGSSCIYPKMAPQPIVEEALLTGPLEPTNEWYAVAKIAGIKLCQAYRRQYGADFISAMPTNLYGPGDNFDLKSSHVLPALMRKCHEAKERGDKQLEVWGSGAPMREFMHVDDLAAALVFLLQQYSDEQHVNVGVGYDVTIADLARMVMSAVGLDAELVFDKSKPDGTPRKIMDSSKLANLGWTASIPLEDGIRETYRWFLDNYAHGSA